MSAQLRESNVEHLRIPPQAVDAEQNVLGGLMLAACGGIDSQERAWANVADLITADDFYRRDHQLIFRAIAERHGAQVPFDPIVLGDWFASQGDTDLAGGSSYLTGLCSTVASFANIRSYADIVRKKALFRQLIEVGTSIVGAGFDPGHRDADDVIASCAAQVAGLTQRSTGSGLRPGHVAVDKAWQDIRDRGTGAVPLGLPLPWGNVRNFVPGLEETDFMVLAARPSMGKTVGLIEIAEDTAASGKHVALFSLEMSAEALMARLMSRHANVDGQKLRIKDGLSDDEWRRIEEARGYVRKLPIAIDDSAGLNVDALCARATRMHAKVKGGLGVVGIDYLQLIAGTGRDQNRHEEISYISRRLKQLAKDLRCPVVALSQLNRSLETRTDKRPGMADLRESGAIEQDADVIVFIYRDDYYSKDKCGAPGIAEFIIAKQRNGPTGTAYLRHHLEVSRFDDYHGQRPNYSPKGGKAANDGFDDDDVPRSGRDRASGRD